MGAKGSKVMKEEKFRRESKNNLDQRVLIAFNALSQGAETISCKHFTDRFGDDLGSNLWKYLSDSASEKWQMDLTIFGKRFLSLIGPSTDRYMVILLPAEQIIRVCAQCAGVIDINEGDEQFVLTLTNHMEKSGNSTTALMDWKNEYCRRLCDSVQARVMNGFNLAPDPNLVNYASDVLSALQMWFIHCSLPEVYFPQPKMGENGSSERCWRSLYSSLEQGISVTKFEAYVFDYRGPTVAAFRLKDGAVLVLAVDQEWRNSGSTFGSVDSVFMQLAPEFRRIQKSSSIYCNFRLRNFPMKLAFNRHMTIDKEMSEVVALEVFGCSGAHTLEEQKKQKEWQRKQIEKNKKVPLPGKWDDNPDKYLLELGGVYSTADRREVFRRDD